MWKENFWALTAFICNNKQEVYFGATDEIINE